MSRRAYANSRIFASAVVRSRDRSGIRCLQMPDYMHRVTQASRLPGCASRAPLGGNPQAFPNANGIRVYSAGREIRRAGRPRYPRQYRPAAAVRTWSVNKIAVNIGRDRPAESGHEDSDAEISSCS